MPLRPVPPAKQSLVVYDAECGFCRRTVAKLRTLDRSGRLRFRPLQDEALYRDEPRLSRAACQRTLHLVTEDGVIHAGGDAFRETMTRVGAGRVTWVLRLPLARTVTELVYRAVAAARSRIPL